MQFYISVFPKVSSWLDISIVDKKMTNHYIPQETQYKMHLYPIVLNMQLTVTGIFKIESSH